MNTKSELDRIMQDWLDDRVVEPRQSGLDAVLDRLTTTHQRRRRWLDRWLHHGTSATRSARARGGPEDIHDTRRNKVMLSSTGIVGAIVVLVLGAVLVLPADRARAPVGPAAGTASTYVVAQDGSGDFVSVGEAVAAAADGDTIMVKPGVYVEAVTIAKDITLAGDGPREQIVIENPPDGPVVDREVLSRLPSDLIGIPPQFTLLLEDSDAIVSGLTVSGPMEGGITTIVVGGAPTLDNVAVVLEGPAGTWEAWAAMYVLGSSHADVRGSEFNGWVQVSDGSSATFEDGDFFGHVHVDGPGETTLRGNSFNANPRSGSGGVDFAAGATGLVEGNDVTAGAVEVAGDSDVVVSDNVVGGQGIRVIDEDTTAQITGNKVGSSQRGIDIGAGAEAAIEGNTITGGLAGLFLASDAVVAEGNTITGAVTGILVDGDATPTLRGNSLCDNETDLRVDEGNPTTLDGNEVCAPDASPAASG